MFAKSHRHILSVDWLIDCLAWIQYQSILVSIKSSLCRFFSLYFIENQSLYFRIYIILHNIPLKQYFFSLGNLRRISLPSLLPSAPPTPKPSYMDLGCPVCLSTPEELVELVSLSGDCGHPICGRIWLLAENWPGHISYEQSINQWVSRSINQSTD